LAEPVSLLSVISPRYYKRITLNVCANESCDVRRAAKFSYKSMKFWLQITHKNLKKYVHKLFKNNCADKRKAGKTHPKHDFVDGDGNKTSPGDSREHGQRWRVRDLYNTRDGGVM